MRNILILVLFFLFGGTSSPAQQVPKPAVEDQQWDQLKDQTHVSFASSDVRFAKDAVPQITEADEWNAAGWKGEKLHTQILVWTRRDIPDVSLHIGDLTNQKGEKILSKNLSAGFLRYVMADEFAGGCGYRKPEDFDSSMVADAIDPARSVPVKKKNVQPVWLRIQIPSTVAGGLYSGFVTVNAGKKYKLKLTVRVLDQVLPPTAEWKFDLDLWQHPAAIARVHQVPLWSEGHFDKMRPYYTMLAGAGQKAITASIMNEPWGHQTYDDYPGLIKWIRKKDGSWVYDYSLFDKYISFVMSCGIKGRINCYTMIPWKLSFQYFDESLNKDTVLTAKPGSPEYNAHWSAMLHDFTRHLKAKGWFEITSIAMDERPMPDMQAVIRLVKAIDPQWKIALAGDYHPEIEKDIDDYCIASSREFDKQVLDQRKAAGKPSTWYTCCTEAYPNGFTFSPPAEHVWTGWYTAAKGFTGFLRWAYNSWPADPLSDSRFTAWPSGDTYQVYPGPMSSVRFEKLVEGIQDFEKIRILRQRWTETGDSTKLSQLDKILSEFEISSLEKTKAADMVLQAKAALNRLY